MRTRAAISFALAMAAAVALGSSLPAVELKVGDNAPDFELKGSDGKIHKLSDLKDKKAVVVAWFPKAKTGG